MVREAEDEGFMVGMTGFVQRKRTDLNNELSTYFREQLPKYSGTFDEDKGEDILSNINAYLKEKEINKHPLDFPLTSGTDIHLIPVTENLQLKVLVADEYYGDGDYSKYVMADYFLINENTTKQDVESLIEFIKNYIK